LNLLCRGVDSIVVLAASSVTTMDANVDPAALAATANAELPCIQISRRNLQDGSFTNMTC
jgi:hypothetical protein